MKNLLLREQVFFYWEMILHIFFDNLYVYKATEGASQKKDICLWNGSGWKNRLTQ
jgi:hypothetical protein